MMTAKALLGVAQFSIGSSLVVASCRQPPSGNRGENGDMSDRPEGTVADAGEAVQRKINQASDAHDQIETFIRNNPMTAALIALGIGYVLGKII
jgi:hypothetical protein